MNHDTDTLDLSGLTAGAPTETLENAREQLLAKVMASQQALSKQFSKIDHPFATVDAQDDYDLATAEFEALIKCSIHMPESIEGIRFLEGWHKNRMEQVELLLAHATPGNRLAFGEGVEPVPISEEFARGMRAGLLVVLSMFKNFPLELSIDDDSEGAQAK